MAVSDSLGSACEYVDHSIRGAKGCSTAATSWTDWGSGVLILLTLRQFCAAAVFYKGLEFQMARPEVWRFQTAKDRHTQCATEGGAVQCRTQCTL